MSQGVRESVNQRFSKTVSQLVRPTVPALDEDVTVRKDQKESEVKTSL